MPLRNDPSLWFNLPGIVAAYQPVRAPDSLLARYNMRQGGTSAFRAEPGALPAWSAATGWTGGSNRYLKTNIVPENDRNWSMLARFTGGTDSNQVVAGSQAGVPRFYFALQLSGGDNKVYYSNGGFAASSPYAAAGVLAFAGRQGYRDGIADGGLIGASGSTGEDIYLFANNNGTDTASTFFTGSIQAFAIYNRTLTPAEVWQVSRQMQYCDVNPDWSVWSPRRKWFPYVLAGAGGFQAAWAERANRLIGGG